MGKFIEISLLIQTVSCLLYFSHAKVVSFPTPICNGAIGGKACQHCFISTTSPPHLYSPWTSSYLLSSHSLFKILYVITVELHLLWRTLNICSFIQLKNIHLHISVTFFLLQKHWSTTRSICLNHLFMASACEDNYTETCSMLAVYVQSLQQLASSVLLS